MESSIFGCKADVMYMKQALDCAHQAAKYNEVPVGAVVVDEDGAVLSTAYNQTITQSSQAAHSEIQALQKAGLYKKDWRLEGCWLYVTLEPCMMCMGLIYMSRLEGIVYAAQSPLFGLQLDKKAISSVYKINTLKIVSGVCQQEASNLLKQFFIKKRMNSGKVEQKT